MFAQPFYALYRQWSISFLRLVALLLCVCWLTPATADTLDDILSGKYEAETLSETQIDSLLGNLPTGRYRLEHTNPQPLFRRSFLADYTILDTLKQTRKPLTDCAVRDAVMSPNGRYVAFAKGNNLYLHKLDFGTEVAVTTDQNPNIINGVADWLYEEEFSTTCLFAFSPDSKQLAFIRLDQSAVDSCVLPNLTIRYARAGKNISRATLCIYDIATKAIRTIPTHETDEECYLPRLRWTNIQKDQPAQLLVLKLNRDQNKQQLLSCNPKSTVVSPLYQEESKEYFIDFQLFDEWQWLSDNRFIVLSERNGWRSAYLYSAQGKMLRQLTADGVDLTAIYGYDEQNAMLYYQQATTPLTRQGMVMNLKKGTTSPLTSDDGMHSLRFSADFRQMIDCYQSLNTPLRYTLYALNPKTAVATEKKVVKDNAAVAEAWQKAGLPEAEFVQTDGGLNGYIIKPKGFETGKKYPVVMVQYSGPASQMVLNRWRKRWEYYLAEQGYVVACFDPRGTDCRGRAFRNASYRQLGKVEAEDQIAAAHYMQALPYVDADRLCLWGWSYGGYQTLRTMSCADSPFKCGIAVAPVTDWQLYDAAYTERYMQRPQVNDFGYTESSLLLRAKDLKGNLLLVHGLADDNVH
ncbi:MAG: DPP IV N-terminal domain-containing protein, partial [Paludibacteraceae bacterium]